ncbi:MAG: hypothetical protein V2I76_03000 [Roseobacter sp.]|jgi:hypothetical protein|nr:hypothetical protein [Roseobacter sp.]
MPDTAHPTDSILIHYRRGPILGAMIIALLVLAACLGLLWFSAPFDSGFVPADIIMLGGAVFFAGMFVVTFRLAVMDSVALKFDAKGISGQHIPDLAWSEIAEVVETAHGRYAEIGIVLHAPKRVFARWSLWEKRFLLKLPSKVHFAFLTYPLAASRGDVLATMQRHLDVAGR